MKILNAVLFMVLSIAFLLAWNFFVVPRLAPPKPAPAAHQPMAAQAGKESGRKAGNADAKTVAAQKGAVKPNQKSSTADKAETADVSSKAPGKEKEGAPPLKIATFPLKTVTLGSHDPDSGYFFAVNLTSKGASVDSIELNDDRYRELDNSKLPLRVVGDDSKADLRTFNTDVPEVDALLSKDKTTLAESNWEVADLTRDPQNKNVVSGVTFRYPSPDGQLVLEKHYWIEKIPGAEGTSRAAHEVRDVSSNGYMLRLDVTLSNKSTQNLSASYVLQGPVGLPLENIENAYVFRDVKLGYLTDSGAVTAGKTKSAADLVKEKDQPEKWKKPLKYIGVDVQYFASLVLPVENQLTHETIEQSMPMVLTTPEQTKMADVSVQLQSAKVDLAPHESVTHKFELFSGPKRRALLEPLQAEAVLDYGWFASVSHAMLWLLQFFHDAGIPYGLAIVCLTLLVRACMFPISLRQAAQAQRMKDMNPKLQEIKKKYANDKEKLAKANMELMRQYGVNPLGGCLPILVQMPVFIGLYRALQYSVDLRRAPFLYFDNLAGPDALFHLPFALPFLGTEFNLLPILTIGLFVVQQKMFMPPPTDEQQAMQYKMMNVMMVVMGVLYYHVPAGLCIYFICSSLWGLGERKILTWWKSGKPGVSPGELVLEEQPQKPAQPVKPLASARSAGDEQRGALRNTAGSFWQRLVSAADAASAEATSGSKAAISRRAQGQGKKNGQKKGR